MVALFLNFQPCMKMNYDMAAKKWRRNWNINEIRRHWASMQYFTLVLCCLDWAWNEAACILFIYTMMILFLSFIYLQ